MSAQLRIGVLAAASGSVEGWQAYIISKLRDDPLIEWAAVIQHKELVSPSAAFGEKLKNKWRRIPDALAVRIVERVDAFVGRSSYRSIGAFQVDERYSLSELLPGVPTIHVTPSESPSGLVQRFDDATVDLIRDLRLDVLIRLGFKILRGKILTAARFGIVSYHHADNRINRGGPCGFWEVYDDLNQTGATVQVLTEELDGGIVVRRGIYPTHRLSWNGNRRRLRATSTWLMIDAIRELAKNREWPVAEDARPLQIYSEPLYLAPGLRYGTIFLAKMAARLFRHYSSRLFSMQQWRVLYHVGPASINGGPAPAPVGPVMWKMKALLPPHGRFYADPFLFWHEGTLYLFLEDYSRATGKALIVCFEWNANAWKHRGAVLERPYHLSYPFVFEQDGRIFMIPESLEARRVELWEAEEFPLRWKLARVLLEGVAAVDSSILVKEGIVYLFTNLDRSEIGDPGTELHIYSTEDLMTGEFVPHPQNPVLQDCRVARNGGGFFTDAKGRLIRTAQQNGSSYGQGLAFREVKCLSQISYEEETVETVAPRWERKNLLGMHHANFAQGSVVMDSLHRVRRF